MEVTFNKMCYYFAYGSNMNPERMVDRGVEFIKRELGELKGYILLFNKSVKSNGTAAANIIEDERSIVYGALYTCRDDHVLKQLDKYEGVVNNQYYRIELLVSLQDGASALASVYIANPDACETGLLIHPSYLEHLLMGKDILPSSYFDFLCSFKEQTVPGVPVYHYFAYGSDMNPLAIKERGLTFTRRELGYISNHKLFCAKMNTFDVPVVGNIVQQYDSRVEGAVYKFYNINPFEHLDNIYGVQNSQCIRKQFNIELNDGGSVQAHVFVANEDVCNASF